LVSYNFSRLSSPASTFQTFARAGTPEFN
jgi:hypothetical protein